MNKYAPLSEYLTNSGLNSITLALQEIEDILGFPLPKSAKYRAFWENSEGMHVQAKAWLSSGYTAKVNLREKTLIFQKTKSTMPISQNQTENPGSNWKPRTLEENAKEAMSAYFGKPLRHRKKDEWAKLFDLVSDDFQIVGDIKCLTMGRETKIPPAKASIISENVWMLEKTKAAKTFLVFGKDRRVPQEWLRRYGNLVDSVKFYFLSEDGNIEQLK